MHDDGGVGRSGVGWGIFISLTYQRVDLGDTNKKLVRRKDAESCRRIKQGIKLEKQRY